MKIYTNDDNTINLNKDSGIDVEIWKSDIMWMSRTAYT